MTTMPNSPPQRPFQDFDTENQPFRAPKTAELVARELRNRIVRGELKEDDTLPAETDLMAQFSISRPTLREALRILESESLLTVTRGSRGGPRVHAPDPRVAARHLGYVLQNRGTTLADLYSTRLLMEPSAARHVAIHARDRAPAVLRAIVEKQRQTLNDDMANSRVSASFHKALIELTDNHALILFMGMLNHLYERQVSLTTISATFNKSDASSKKRVIRTHEKLIELIEGDDPDRVAKFWRTHLESIGKTLGETYQMDNVIDMLNDGMMR